MVVYTETLKIHVRSSFSNKQENEASSKQKFPYFDDTLRYNNHQRDDQLLDGCSNRELRESYAL